MKHLLHWGAFILISAASIPTYLTHGLLAYLASLFVLTVALLMQWAEGRFYGGAQ